MIGSPARLWGASSMALSRPTVSVIIPTYNRRGLLLRAVRSVLQQEFQDFEIIVIDDGSTDGTAEAVAEIQRCRLLRTERLGPAGARNAGIAAASGRYLAFLDSDDCWLKAHLSVLTGAMRQPEVGLAYTPTRTVDRSGRRLGGRRDRRKCHGGRVAEPLFEHIFVHTSNVLCRADLVREVGGFDESLPVCEDYHLWLRLALRSRFACVEECTSLRCWHREALSRQNRLRNAVVRAAMLERFYLVEGGKDAIRTKVASRRLGKVYYQAGRALMRAGQRAGAAKFFAKSLQYRPVQVRGWWRYAACRLYPEPPDRPDHVQQLLDRLAWSV